MRIVAFIAVLFVSSVSSAQQDYTINVLAVQLNDSVSGQSANASVAQGMLATMTANWPNPTSITMTLANSGGLTPLTVALTGTTRERLEAAKSAEVASGIRKTADVVVFFTHTLPSGFCGFAYTEAFTSIVQGGTGTFQDPDNDDLDLRDADTGYAVIVNTDLACRSAMPHIALHEVGHLFGTGHDYGDPPMYDDNYLYSDSHAIDFYYPPYSDIRTIMANYSPAMLYLQFSNSYGYKNRRAVDRTAYSLANYRTGAFPGPPGFAQCSDGYDNDGNALTDYPQDPNCSSPTDETESAPQPPGCGLMPPIVVSGATTGVCVPLPWTSHLIWWIDACPSASSHYEVWYQFWPYPYRYGWSTPSPIDSAFVSGGNAEVKIRSCSGASCSSLSSDSYYALSQC